METIHHAVQRLVLKAQYLKLIEEEDVIYARNQVLSLLHLDDFQEVAKEGPLLDHEIPELLDEIVEYACQQKIIEDFFDSREIFSSKIMNCFVARPSTINRTFYKLFNENPDQATDYFYQLSRNSNYIQTKRIEKNIEYKVDTEYGEIDITINLSKPEKDPVQIEKEKVIKSVGYPKCLLCAENEGYAGRVGHPARTNHRVIRVDIDDERWLLQYSPYLYYREHCILLSEHHRNMKIDEHTFSNLLAFIDQFPHYFLGSNADLPIVGGSILSHDHYQGGRYEFPMARAEKEQTFRMSRFVNVELSTLKWPMSVIRLNSYEREEIKEASSHILSSWKRYSDPSVDIMASTNDVPHNTITPIARKRNDGYEIDLVLRNNRTDQQHPLGIFHPHADVHHIKRENIGLIEVMGLAVLPARLKNELKAVESFLLDGHQHIAEYHLQWARQLKDTYRETINEENVESIVRKEVGVKFKKALEDASVFKRNEKGTRAFMRFIESL